MGRLHKTGACVGFRCWRLFSRLEKPRAWSTRHRLVGFRINQVDMVRVAFFDEHQLIIVGWLNGKLQGCMTRGSARSIWGETTISTPDCCHVRTGIYRHQPRSQIAIGKELTIYYKKRGASANAANLVLITNSGLWFSLCGRYIALNCTASRNTDGDCNRKRGGAPLHVHALIIGSP